MAKQSRKKRKRPVTLTEEQEIAFAKAVFNGAIVKQAAFEAGISEKQAYRVLHKHFEWRLMWKRPMNEEITNERFDIRTTSV